MKILALSMMAVLVFVWARIIMLVLVTPSFAEDIDPVKEAMKKQILMQAYHLNGESMVRWGCIDMSKPTPEPCPMPGPPEPKTDQSKVK